MKKILMIAAIAGVGLATFSGCSKSSSSSPSESMTAKINGANYSNSNVTATISGPSMSVSSSTGVTTITYPFVTFGVFNYTGVGTYTANSSGGMNVFGIDSSTTAALVGAYGTVVVSSASSSYISGTFSFTCSDSTKVTSGTFTAKVN